MTGGEFSDWRKSSYSDANGNCVEASSAERLVGIRDTKQHGKGPVIRFPAAAWKTFIADIRKRPLKPEQ